MTNDLLKGYMIFLFAAISMLIIYAVGQAIYLYSKKKKIKEKIMDSYFLGADEFLKSKKEIFKTGEFSKSGCYVILVSKTSNHSYDGVYIGQSLNVSRRVKQHLNGNGNSKVYRDYIHGKKVAIHFEMCAPSYMNRLEKDLIWAFDATKSYNTQKGGGVHRRNKDNWKYT